MCKLKTVLWVNVVLFALIALLHLLRLLFQWPVQFASWQVPLWLNGVFVILAGAMLYLNTKNLKA